MSLPKALGILLTPFGVHKMKRLFIVATPIGNLQDISLRAIKTLFEADIILAEDVSKTKNLLRFIRDKYPILADMTHEQRLISFNEFEEENKIPYVLSLLEESNIALVSSAGTPLISDPGFKLVRDAYAKGVKIISIPGPSSVMASLTLSTLPTDKFLFLGFLPRTLGKKATLLASTKRTLVLMSNEKMLPTVIFLESPHRIRQTLTTLVDVFGNIEIVICRELTKIYEEVVVGTIDVVLENKSLKNPKGEFVILFNLKAKTNNS